MQQQRRGSALSAKKVLSTQALSQYRIFSVKLLRPYVNVNGNGDITCDDDDDEKVIISAPPTTRPIGTR